jgi:hypothetical protein
MPNEHLKYPKFDAVEWKSFHESNRKALNEGEIADRWFADKLNNNRSIDDFKLLSRGNSSSNSSRASTDTVFEDWKKRTEIASEGRTGLAKKEADTFQAIASKDLANNNLLTVASGVSDIYKKLVPRRLTNEEWAALAERQHPSDRGPWEAALGALHQFGLRPDDPNFAPVLESARLRIRSSAGNLVDEFNAFLKAAEIAVAEAALPPWDGSQYKSVAEALRDELRNWQALMDSSAEPNAEEMAARANACARELVRLADECAPVVGRGSTRIAFTSLNGLAMGMAIGEQMAAQMVSRTGAPTIGTLYDRLREIPNRSVDISDPNDQYNSGFTELGKTWKDDFKIKKKILRDKKFAAECERRSKLITEKLQVWDDALKNTNTLLIPTSRSQLKPVVNEVAYQLSDFRRFVDDKGKAMSNDIEFQAECKELLSSTEKLVAQMQRRLALYYKLVS